MEDAIFIIVNDNHFKYVIPFLNSIKTNWNKHPKILCHHASDLTLEQIDILKSYSNIELVPLKLEEHEVGECPFYKSQGMLIAYGKLRIWSRLYDNYNNILFLDVDTLILKPLDDLMAATEFTIFRSAYKFEFLNKSDTLRSLLTEDGLSSHFNSDYKYSESNGNSGVMLIPKKIRTKEIYDKLMYILDRYKKYNMWADQAVINLWMIQNNIPPSQDVTYNFLTFYLNPSNDYWSNKNYDTEIDDLVKNSNIIHFVLKPEEILKQPYMKTSEKSKTNSTLLSGIFDYYSNLTN